MIKGVAVNGFTAFHVNDTSRVGSAYLPMILWVRVFLAGKKITDHVLFLAQACQRLWLVDIDDIY